MFDRTLNNDIKSNGSDGIKNTNNNDNFETIVKIVSQSIIRLKLKELEKVNQLKDKDKIIERNNDR